MTLKELEKKVTRIRPARLVVLALTPDGQDQHMSVDERIQTQSRFLRALRGNDVNDVWKILDYEYPDCAIK